MIVLIPIVAVALIVLLIPLTGADYQLRRILHFQRRRLKGTELPDVLPIFREATTRKHKVPLVDVRDLVLSLQLGTSMEATLTGSLAKATEQFADRGLLGERLQRHVEAKLSSIGPRAVIEGLVDDLDCPQLVEVLERIRMAEDGGISYHQVLAVSADAIDEDIRGSIEQAIQKAPTRLTLPMVIGVFFPALILGLFPLLAFGVSQMQSP